MYPCNIYQVQVALFYILHMYKDALHFFSTKQSQYDACVLYTFHLTEQSQHDR